LVRRARSRTADAFAAIIHKPGAASLHGGIFQVFRYTIASGLALSFDFALYLLLVAMGINAAAAGTFGYAAGLALHYLLSVSFVFDARATRKRHARLAGEFVLSGLAGLVITATVIAAAINILGVSPLTAKVAASIASFSAVFAVRRLLVFRHRAAVPRSQGAMP
jgi:putative flippase GtrA